MTTWKRISQYVLLSAIFPISAHFAQARDMAQINVIPAPNEIKFEKGQFTLNQDTAILAQTNTADTSKYLKDILAPATGFDLTISQSRPPKNYIELLISDSKNIAPEGYELTADNTRILITASEPAGLFYGIQTLRQLLPTDIFSAKPVKNIQWSIPAVSIKDQPRFKWRGLHLDVCRHFMPAAFVKKYIDLLAVHKMNTFHWHLTEDQGWRIEIKKYPRLTEIGAWRKETLIGHLNNEPRKYDGQRYGGFYTQEEIKDIVKYASERYVNIVPEIEMPGHAVAALAAYPELSCTGGPFEVATDWGIFRDAYCAGNEKTFAFLEEVLSEVIQLFPGKYIHIGGDECEKDRWEKCPKCQARIKQENLKDERELQSYFIKRIETFLNKHNKTLIGWDEILEGGLSPNAAVMSWRGEKGGVEAAGQSHYVVMSPNSHCYLNYYQADPAVEPLAIGGDLPLQKVYSYDPLPTALTDSQKQYILGLQGNLWTEYIKTPEMAEYMAYPRAIAIAETDWSQMSDKDYTDFLRRLKTHLKRLDGLNVNYRPMDKPTDKTEKSENAPPALVE